MAACARNVGPGDVAVLDDGQPREAALMAGELEGLIGEIDGYEAEKAEILMAIAYARYVSGELGDALRTTDRLRQVPDADLSEVAPASALSGAIKVMLGQRDAGSRDIRLGVERARAADPLTFVIAVGYWSDLVSSVLTARTRNTCPSPRRRCVPPKRSVMCSVSRSRASRVGWHW